MKRGLWMIWCFSLMLLLGFLVRPEVAIGEGGLFEEEEEVVKPKKETKGGAEVKIPRTAEARKLAAEVLGKVAKSYFNLLSEGVTAFDATFTLEQEGKSAGKIKVTWSKSEEEISIEFEEGEEETDAHAFVKDLFDEEVFMAVVAGPFAAASAPSRGIYAVKSGKKYILDMTEYAKKEDSEIQAQLVFVSADLSELEGMRVVEGGDVWGRIYRGEESEGKRFISSSTMTLQEEGELAGKAEFKWTYARKDGVPFIKRIRLNAEGEGEKLACSIVLDKVTFKKGRKVAEPEEEEPEEETEKLME